VAALWHAPMKLTTLGWRMDARMAISRSKNCLKAAWLLPAGGAGLEPGLGLRLPWALPWPLLLVSVSNTWRRFTATCWGLGLGGLGLGCRLG